MTQALGVRGGALGQITAKQLGQLRFARLAQVLPLSPEPNTTVRSCVLPGPKRS